MRRGLVVETKNAKQFVTSCFGFREREDGPRSHQDAGVVDTCPTARSRTLRQPGEHMTDTSTGYDLTAASAGVDPPSVPASASAMPGLGVPGGSAGGCKLAGASDEYLMQAYRDGDATAFRLLYQRHRGGLYRFLLRQAGVHAVAEELFQDVWMNLIGARERYVPSARFATYLYRIAHNRLVDHFRRSAQRPGITARATEDDADPIDLLEADPSEQPDAKFDAKTRLQRFSELLAALPSEQREAFVMHEESGLGVDEIAAATGVSFETAKSRLRYAITKLRRGLMELM